jgi:Flp pilus assembly CpaE family ATPase
MIWLVLALVVAFALAESLVIERLWRDQRRTRQEFDELFDQVDALAIAVDRQVLTQEQMQDQIKPAVAAIRESNQVVVETMDQLVGTIREAKGMN